MHPLVARGYCGHHRRCEGRSQNQEGSRSRGPNPREAGRNSQRIHNDHRRTSTIITTVTLFVWGFLNPGPHQCAKATLAQGTRPPR